MKILNAYCCLGGNRAKWGNEHDITAIEIIPEIAMVYQDFYPDDKVIITDAHEYILKNFQEYDFIWSSPPCPKNSRMRRVLTEIGQVKPSYPSLILYEEAILLKHFFKGLYCIENVISYYEPLIKPRRVGRHYLWANFNIPDFKTEGVHIQGNVTFYKKKIGIDLTKYKLKHRKDTLYRNYMNPQLGKHILDCAMGIYNFKKDVKQLELI